VNGQLLNAAPGLFFGVGGLVTLGVTIWKGVEIKVSPVSPGQALRRLTTVSTLSILLGETWNVSTPKGGFIENRPLPIFRLGRALSP
jgi:hypothetical protein